MEIEVKVIDRQGREKTLPSKRPVHTINERMAVTYKGKKYYIGSDGVIDLRSPRLASEPAPEKSRSDEIPAAPDAPVRLLTISGSYNPDLPGTDGQVEVIQALPEMRQLVDAPPGAGKTHVACSRIVHLVREHRIQASNIWLISFTRTAVREVRNRIEVLAEDIPALRGLRPTTLDSLAARVRAGSDSQMVVDGYDANIKAFLDAVESNPGTRDAFFRLRHVIIDEAQDIVGTRADMVLKMLETLPPECGVTIFADAAQSIYGFAEGEDDEDGPPLLPRLQSLGFEQRQLTGQYRTKNEHLGKIIGPVRTTLLDDAVDTQSRYAFIRKSVSSLAGISPAKFEEFRGLPENCFVLFRSRPEALFASSVMNQNAIPHRLRMSGLPLPVEPWIAGALFDVADNRVSRGQFSEQWARYIAGTMLESISLDSAWALLLNAAGDRTGRIVEMDVLRETLSRRAPLELCRSEFGEKGPIVGTIHASKGREADVVHLRLPKEMPGDEQELGEEARVLFVGATRAREQLFVGSPVHVYGSKLASGRAVMRFGGKPWLNTEVGREEDIDIDDLVGRTALPDAETALKAQLGLTSLVGSKVVAKLGRAGDQWRYLLEKDEDPHGMIFGCLSERCSRDMWEAARRLNSRSKNPKLLRHIYVIGLRTVATMTRDALHDPWRGSGLALAPLLIGFGGVSANL